MRIVKYIRANLEPILQAWEDFADTIPHDQYMDRTALRDHAREMLLAIVEDLESNQSESEQTAKSKGHEPNSGASSWAGVHGSDRQASGFSIMETVSEFRALRASVVSLWTNSNPTIDKESLMALTRFHEAIDQAITRSLEQYSTLKERETRLFGATLLVSPDPIFVLDKNGRFVYVNQATAGLLAMAPRAIIENPNIDLGSLFGGDFLRNMEKVMVDQTTCRGSFVHTFPSGAGEKYEYVLAPVLDEQHNTEATACIVRDITEQARAEAKIWHSAHHDLLTGLPNRRLFLDRLEQEVKHAKRNSQSLAVLFLDLDGFKAVNDSLGHEVGDRLLYTVAERLTHCVREEDSVARLGGDEFTVILTGAEQHEDAELVARNIIEALTVPLQIEDQTVQISASIGITFFPQDASSPVTLLDTADQAMYNAKKPGSNRLFFFDAIH